MLEQIMTKAIEFGERYEKPITWAGGAWFAISCASWIPWMPIPDIPYVTDSNSWVLSGAWNAIWWGFVHPALDKHRAKMQAGSAEHPPQQTPKADSNTQSDL